MFASRQGCGRRNVEQPFWRVSDGIRTAAATQTVHPSAGFEEHPIAVKEIHLGPTGRQGPDVLAKAYSGAVVSTEDKRFMPRRLLIPLRIIFLVALYSLGAFAED